MLLDFAPAGNNGPDDNANLHMQSSVAVNDNQWHAFKGERYCCRCETGATGAEYASEWGASSCGEANRGECLTCSRNGAEDGRRGEDHVDEDGLRVQLRLGVGDL